MVDNNLTDMQCCQNILYLKYYTLFWQSLRIILYLYFFSVKYFKNTLLKDKIVYKDQKYLIYTFFLKYLMHVSSLSPNGHIKKKNLLAPSALA